MVVVEEHVFGVEFFGGNLVAVGRAEQLRVLRRRPVLALFDGEPVTLAPDTEVTGGMTRPAFIATLEDGA